VKKSYQQAAKHDTTAFLLCFFLGLFGAHRFYLNQFGSGLAHLALTVVVGPEILSGSTRLKAGTATKLVLNTLTTGAMVRLGKTFGNLMVDLRATNDKLRARTNRIVRQLTGLTRDQANALLERCDRELKTALVAQLATVSPEEARARLTAANGQVLRTLGPTAASTTPAEPDLVLGMDGGGTRTVALLAPVNAAGPWAASIGQMVGLNLPVTGTVQQVIVTEPAPPMSE